MPLRIVQVQDGDIRIVDALGNIVSDTPMSALATEATLNALGAFLAAALDVPLSSRASEATLLTRATEATLATRASEATLLTRLSKADFEARINTLGQKVMAASTPIVIASDQSDVGVKQPTAALLNAQIQGPAADGAPIVGNPVRMGASDGVNTQDVLGDTSGRLVIVGPATTGAPAGGVQNVQGVDVAASLVALGALNAAATVTVNGQHGAGFQLAAGTLIGTIVAEASYDGGTTYSQIPFWNPTTRAFLNSLVFGAANTATALAILVPAGAGAVRVRVSAYTSGTANATVRASAVAPPVSMVSGLDGNKPTYSAAITGLVFALAATDIFTITGSASKTIRVITIAMSATQTAGARRDVQLVKRSTANTVGTSTAPAVVPHDSSDPAGTATVLAYTVNPTLGALVGLVRTRKVLIDSANASGSGFDDAIWHFGDKNDRSGVLRGTGDVISINMNGVTSAGNNANAYVMWTEE
jgi:hypothetical protein